MQSSPSGSLQVSLLFVKVHFPHLELVPQCLAQCFAYSSSLVNINDFDCLEEEG